MYVAVMDGRTRPSHAALNGQVWRRDDPVWQVIFPPNGFNCRCRTRMLTRGQMDREGLTLPPSPQLVQRTVNAGTDAATGELFPTVQHGVQVTGANGQRTTMWVDAGFNASPLAGHAFDTLLARKAVAALGDSAGFEQVRQAVLSPPRMKAWAAFVQGAVNSGVLNKNGQPAIQGQSMTAGILELSVTRKLAQSKTPFAPVVHVPDRLLIGKKAIRHDKAQDALSTDDWMQLPHGLAGASAYRDVETGKLILLYAHGTSELSVQVALGQDGGVRTVYLVRNELIEEKIRAGRWATVQ